MTMRETLRSPSAMLMTHVRFFLNSSDFTRNEASIHEGWIHVQGTTICALGEGDAPEALSHSPSITVVDGLGAWVVPGFIDIHVHGADGAEVMDGNAKSIGTIGRFHAAHGTTGWLPTTLTAPINALEQSIRAVDEVSRLQEVSSHQDLRMYGAAVLGLHLEGPFISPDKVGAQNPEFVCQPSVDVMDRLMNVSPSLIKKVTLAPEQEGAAALIPWLCRRSIIPSIGHTDASYAQTMAAIELGATHATHLFNAMRGLHHRDAGTVGACLLGDAVVCELIADGFHVDIPVMQLAVRTKGTERIVLITDAISATGKPEGSYQLGGLDVVVKGGKSVLKDSGALAGSTLTMDQAVRNMVSKVGVSLHDAIQMASTNPARELGLQNQKGRIAPGFDADLVMLDDELHVVRTFVQGKEVYRR